MPELEIPCVQCKEIFVFNEKEQEIFYQRNMTTPQRCPQCRSKKNADNNSDKTRYEIICDHCGKNDSVPFQPKVGRPVLCKNCFQTNRSRAKLF